MRWLESVGLTYLELAQVPLLTQNYVLACYTMHLTMGNTILAKCIKSVTVERYLSAAAKIHTSQGHCNPTHNLQKRRYHLINDIITESKRWESMPNRREPLTWAMIEYLQTLSCASTSLLAALIDWFIVGMFAGFRLSEWAQPANLPSTISFQRGRRGDSLAITTADIQLTSQGFSITWRYQKNNINGEKIIFHATPGFPARCPYLAIQRILHRASSLRHDPSKPLAMYAVATAQCYLITDKNISVWLQQAAKIAYGISDLDDLARWTSHSVRVGACVALHEAGAEPSTIKNRLRWRSDTFVDYLRHTGRLAANHAALLTST